MDQPAYIEAGLRCAALDHRIWQSRSQHGVLEVRDDNCPVMLCASEFCTGCW